MFADFRKNPYTEYHENRRLFWINIVETASEEKEREYTLSRIKLVLDHWLHTATYK